MNTTVEEANAALRQAVLTRLSNTPKDDPKMIGYTQSCCEGQPMRCDATFHPTSMAFFDLCERLKQMHASKSSDYGCPSGKDPLLNIRNGAAFVGILPWQGAMVRLSDKVTRLATFNKTGKLGHEGVEDTLLDLASYSLLALLLYRETVDRDDR